MAVTVTTNTLSARVRYLNVSASTANEDAKDIVLAMADALVDLGWTRYDTAGATAVIGSDSDAGVILQRACQDFATSGNYNYLGLRLVGSATTTYTFHLIQAADWTGTTSMSSFVNAAQNTVYTPNTTGNTRFLDFLLGGTIWLFDSGKTLVIQTSSGATLTKSFEGTWIISEYKKEFGENVDSSTGYIHNGVFTNDRWLLDGNGVDTAVSPSGLGVTAQWNSRLIGGFVYMGNASQSLYFDNYEGNDTSTTDPNGGIRTASGAPSSQFCLTEAPAISTTTLNSNTQTFPTAPPVSCGFGFATRMLMGYMGYIGHISETFKISAYSHFIGAYNSIGYASNRYTTIFSGVESVPGNDPENPASSDSPGLFSMFGANRYTLINSSSTQEFSPSSSTLQYTIFEPTLSCGTTNGLSNIRRYGTSTADRFNYSGPQYKFSMLGRMYDLKLFGPFTAEKYTFLDSMTIPCNSEGFYEEGGVDKDFWVLPTGNHMAFLMPKT
jgi:hypothetical protein